MESTLAIEFNVSYRLAEYISFVHDVLDKRIPEVNAERGKKTNRFALALTKLAALPILPFVFLYKVSRVGRCRFSIDDACITRSSKAGDTHLPWSEVSSVYSCKRGLLIVGKKGGFPIPDRALASEQKVALRDLALGHGLVLK